MKIDSKKIEATYTRGRVHGLRDARQGTSRLHMLERHFVEYPAAFRAGYRQAQREYQDERRMMS